MSGDAAGTLMIRGRLSFSRGYQQLFISFDEWACVCLLQKRKTMTFIFGYLALFKIHDY
jgi:hypothetical protein